MPDSILNGTCGAVYTPDKPGSSTADFAIWANDPEERAELVRALGVRGPS